MTKSQKKTDYEHVLKYLLKAEIGNPIDLMTMPTCIDWDIHAFINKPKSFLKQISTKKEDEKITLKCHEVGLIRTFSHCILVPTSLSCNLITAEAFHAFRTNAKCRKLGQTRGRHRIAPVFSQDEPSFDLKSLRI